MTDGFASWPILTLGLFAVLLMRYILAAGGFFLFFYTRLGRSYLHRKIEPRFPRPKMYWLEIRYSVLTSFVFAVSGALIMKGWEYGWFPIYLDPARYGYGYLLVSLALLMFLHETYFYWTHRWMHRKSIFPYVHRVHHISVNPSPFASFSFNFWEAVIEAAIVPLLLVFIPVHLGVLVLFLTVMTILGVTNHLGFELLPPGFQRTRLGRWWITSTHHYQHHREVNGNYGLYFTFWDHWMGTHLTRYDELYDEVTRRPPLVEQVATS